MTGNAPSPLRLLTTFASRADVTRALIYLDDFGGDAASRFETQSDAVCAALCQRIAEEIAGNGRPFDAINPEASTHWSQPIYRESLRTGKRTGRNNSNALWYIYYALRDDNNDGRMDAPRVYAVRHSAARPLSLDSPEPDAEDTDTG